MIAELSAIGIVIGVLSGFFGIGGGMILVPILLAVGFDIKTAIGISIMQMVFSSVFGSFLNWKRGTLVLEEGIFVGIGGFIGGFLGAQVTRFASEELLQFLFLGLLFFALFRLFSAKAHDDESMSKSLDKRLLFMIGLGIGVFSIALGVGGSIILTPILVGMLHYPIKKAVSAGLFFVVFSSVSGLIGRLSTGSIDMHSGLIVAFASLVGVSLGIWLKEHVHARHHKAALLILYIGATLILVKKMFLT